MRCIRIEHQLGHLVVSIQIHVPEEILQLSHACGYEHPCQFTGKDIELSSGINLFDPLENVLGYEKVQVPFDTMEKIIQN